MSEMAPAELEAAKWFDGHRDPDAGSDMAPLGTRAVRDAVEPAPSLLSAAVAQTIDGSRMEV